MQGEEKSNMFRRIIFPRKLPTIKEATQALVEEAMRRADQKQSAAAAMLGITQQALSKRLKKSKQYQ